ncbi:MAG: hypothetical protein AVDCRST_MAG71-2898, partial [uncultured Lysobacter sp.]
APSHPCPRCRAAGRMRHGRWCGRRSHRGAHRCGGAFAHRSERRRHRRIPRGRSTAHRAHHPASRRGALPHRPERRRPAGLQPRRRTDFAGVLQAVRVV